MTKPRTTLDYLDPVKRDSIRSSISFVDEEGNPLPSLTKQAFKDEVDFNNVLRKYDKTGLITHVNNARAHYGDYTEVNEYQESLNMVLKAQADFDALPGDVRKRFANDPGNFIEFVTNPDNLDEMRDLGLADPDEPDPQPIQVVVTNPPEPPAE